MDTWEIKISSCDCLFYYGGDCEYMAPSPIFKCTEQDCPRKVKASQPDVEADAEFPHQDCYYNGGCGCNNTRLGVNPRTD